MVRLTRQMILGVVGLAFALSTMPAHGASPMVAALDQASAEADIIIVIPKVADAGRKLNSWLSAAGIPTPMAGGGADALLNDFKRNMGIKGGFNDNGSIVVLISNLAAALEQNAKPDLLLLMPVSDYAAFVGSFGGGANGVTAIKMPQAPPGFARQVGNYALLGQDQATLEAYKPAHQGGAIVASLGARGATVLDGSDAILYINVEKIAPQLKTMVHTSFAQFQMMMAMMGNNTSAQSMTQIMDLYGMAIDAVLDGSSAILIGADVTDDGLGFSEVIRMKGGSALASYFPGGPSTAGVELARLPDQSYIFAGAIDGNAIAIGKLYETIGEVADPAMLEMMGGAAFEKAIALGKNAQSAAFVFYTPDQMAMMSGSMLNTITTIKTKDATAYTGMLRDYIQAFDGFSQPMMGMGDAAITYTTSYTENALQLGGVSVDQFQLQIVMPPEAMMAMGQAGSFLNMFTSYRGYIAAKDGHVIVTTSADPQQVTAALDTAAAGNGLGAAGVVAEQRAAVLPKNAAMEMYLNLGGIAEAANQFMSSFGMPPMIQVPADLPPITSGLAIDGQTLHGRLYVPTPVVQFVMQTWNKTQMMMGGGGPPQQRGGPAPY